MLNLKEEDVFKFSAKEKKIIKEINKNWNASKAINIKKKISQKTLEIQKMKCVYCKSLLGDEVRNEPEIEHFAPKKYHSEFSFEKLNLFSACHYCNHKVKNTKDVIIKKNKTYKKCKFSILHPYLDDVDQHIKYTIEGVVNKKKSTPKGIKTAEFFQLLGKSAISNMLKRELEILLMGDCDSEIRSEIRKLAMASAVYKKTI